MPGTIRELSSLHRSLNRYRGRLERKLQAAVRKWIADLAKRVASAAKNGIPIQKAEDFPGEIIDWGKIEQDGIAYFKPLILESFNSGKRSAYGITGFAGVWDIYSVQAVEAADELCSKLVTQITDSTRNAINKQIGEGLASGLSSREIARRLRDVVGLTDQQASRVVRFRDFFKEEHPDLSVSTVNSRVEAYRSNLITSRLETIARTETARAQTAGYTRTLEEYGVTLYEFSAYPGCCNQYCQELDGQVFPAEEIKNLIPRHPNCRCVALPVIDNQVVKTPR